MTAADCDECERLAGAYESATMTWFRVEGCLRIAEYGRDRKASGSLAGELAVASQERRSIREAIERHLEKSHSNATAAVTV